MKEILVIGVGSRIMTDDAIGINIVEDLKKSDKSPKVSYLLGETDFDYCFEEVLNCDYVIVIDAYYSGKYPGEITVIPMDELNKYNEDNLYSMHGIHLLSLIQHSKHLPDGILIGIEPYEINYGFTLSEVLQYSYPDVLDGVQKIIDKQIAKFGGRNNA